MFDRSASPVSPEDLQALDAAGRELGAGYEDAVADSLVERFEAQLEHQLHQRATSAVQEAVTIAIALGSIGLGVVFALVARDLGDAGGTIATIVAWACIAVVNVAHARARGRAR